ncbi:MAG: hypothetical protein GY856_01240 [bacterium]|nr:hypothetical protein [bacterium]
MRPKGPTFWLLDAVTGWREGVTSQVFQRPGEPRRRWTIRQCPSSGLRLRVDPEGPLALDSADGSLGRLTLPRGVAVGECGIVYLLGLGDASLKRFDPATCSFVKLLLPEMQGEDPERFASFGNIAVVAGDLYLADPVAGRLLVFDAIGLGLRHCWENGREWEPIDVAGDRGIAYFLERRQGAVYRHRPGCEQPELLFAIPEAAARRSRLALDREGRICLLDLDGEKVRLEIYDRRGEHLGTAEESDDVRGRFDPPLVELDSYNRFALPPLGFRCCGGGGKLIFDRDGHPAEIVPAEPPGPNRYLADGTWTSAALDSEIYLCEWHRIDLELRSLPAGSAVEVSTYSDQTERPMEEIRALPEHLWNRSFKATGPMQPPPGRDLRTLAAQRLDHDGLVQSRGGRYLWLRLRVRGDGHDTPRVRSLRIHYPRETYLGDLPAVFGADEDRRWFLNRFLAIFHTEWDGLDRRIAEIARLFDPETVPDGEFVDYLASWLGQPLERSWNWRQKRRLLAALPKILPRRGTREGLERFLGVYLANLSGIEPGDQLGYPRLLEGFRERQFLLLPTARKGELGTAPLWSRCRVGRMQLGIFSREGAARLVSTGEPALDPFHVCAHRFRIFVPAAWVSTAGDERTLRRAVESEKPAHAHYDLCLVEPRLRVGLQATVGIDTVIGEIPVAQLPPGPDQEDPPPSRAPRHRLGYDSVLAAGRVLPQHRLAHVEEGKA